jgi:tetratricopeptide (TPR) repeat protein
MRLASLALLFCTLMLCQSVDSPCKPDPQIQQALRMWNDPADDQLPYAARIEKKQKLIQPLLEKYPKDLLVQRRYMEILRGPMYRTWEKPMQIYKSRLDEEPDDPALLYLYGETLTGRRTPEALALYDKALRKNPNFQPARLALARIYSWYPTWRDLPRAAALMHEYYKACPESTDGYDILPRLNDNATLERALPRLRKILESSPDAPVRRWETLWTLEFRNRPTTTHEAARQQVRLDIDRIKKLGRTNDADWYSVLEGGVPASERR